MSRSGRKGHVVTASHAQSGPKPTYKGKRHAMKPGLRVSKNGKEYWETRRNRSDPNGGTFASR